MGCCTRRRDDGTIDIEAIRRAVEGRPGTQISTREARIACMRLAKTRGWGLTLISEHLGWGRSTVAGYLAAMRNVKP